MDCTFWFNTRYLIMLYDSKYLQNVLLVKYFTFVHTTEVSSKHLNDCARQQIFGNNTIPF